MLSQKTKTEIATKIQDILQSINDEELPKGEINFIIHIDGVSQGSWANIRNNSRKDVPAPAKLIGNETA